MFRDAKMKEMTVHKLEEMEKKLGDTDKTRGQSDRDIKAVRVETLKLGNSHFSYSVCDG